MNIDVDVRPIRARLRSHSKELFGKRYRLEVILAVGASEDPIWSRRMAETLRLPENQVSVELKTLAHLGALQLFPSIHDRRKLYQLVAHPIWAFARELLESTIRELYPEEPRQALGAYWSEVLAMPQPRPVPT
ncbi:MAG TPA: hypothetical protein VFJ65_06965 [Solirubrobacterales bacterium]|nr:hypothetical protein [Solirubrobacterales bacterium]